jgi:hypothetical protein
MRRMPVNAAADMTGPHPSTLRRATQPDSWTIAASAIVASVIGDVIHEGLGHGGMCAVTGGQPLALSTVHFDGSADTRLVAAGGALANLICGVLFWGRRARRQAERILALLLLAADDTESARRGRLFPVLRYRQHR